MIASNPARLGRDECWPERKDSKERLSVCVLHLIPSWDMLQAAIE